MDRSLWYDGYQQVRYPAGRLILNPDESTVMDWRDTNGLSVKCYIPSECHTETVPTQECPHGSGRSSCVWNGGCPGVPVWPLPPDTGGIYGEWCGPGYPPGDRNYITPFPEPIDNLDGCCMQHDKCYDDNNCVGWCWVISAQCRMCDCLLAACSLAADCSTSPNPRRCEDMKWIVGGWMVVQGCVWLIPPVNPPDRRGGGFCEPRARCAW